MPKHDDVPESYRIQRTKSEPDEYWMRLYITGRTPTSYAMRAWAALGGPPERNIPAYRSLSEPREPCFVWRHDTSEQREERILAIEQAISERAALAAPFMIDGVPNVRLRLLAWLKQQTDPKEART